MKTPIPSRQALQHLTRLCHGFRSSTPHQPSNAARSLSTCLRPSTEQFNTHTPRRSFTTTPPHRVQPNTSTDPDPQNAANPVLPDITNYYTLFPRTLPDGPPGPSPPTQSPASTTPTPFNLHQPTLRREFLQLQSQHHPDKFATGSTAHQKALALSALINAAYRTLSDPLQRAQYLLQLQYDVDVTNEDNAAHPTDQETLMEVMEAQERIEEATRQEEIDEIKAENVRRIVETEGKMGQAFEEGNVDEAKNECVRLKYWRSLQSGLDDWEPGKEVRLVH